ncbi:hypothetical protein QCD80_00710 [Pseudomonas syringae pv. actinidiae]|nr:hypothetical protein [Pseudomonas syringae]MDG6432016.1 hypothetical protein [Pseudomonas syringae pv. actinidiae]
MMLLVETTLIFVVLHQQAGNSELLNRWSKKNALLVDLLVK